MKSRIVECLHHLTRSPGGYLSTGIFASKVLTCMRKSYASVGVECGMTSSTLNEYARIC